MQSAEKESGWEKREVKSSVLVDLMYEDESAEENERSFIMPCMRSSYRTI